MKTIGKACDVTPGKTPAKVAYSSSGDVKMIKFRDVLESGTVDYSNNEEGWIDAKYVDDGDLVDLRPASILLTNAAHSTEHIGKKVAYVEQVPNFSRRVCFVGELTCISAKSDSGFNTKWIYYWLQTNDGKSAVARAVEGAHMVPRQFKKTALPTCSASEQAAHVELLELADGTICKARDELEAARTLKRSLEGELLSGRIDGRSRVKITTPAGEYPSGWSVAPLKSLAAIGSGVTLNQDRAAKENACRYLTVAHVQRGAISTDDARYLELSAIERQSRLLESGDVLVVEGHASSMEIGRAAMFEDMGEATTFQNHLFRVRADKTKVLPKFLLYVLNSERVQRHWNAVCNTSSGLNTINRRGLRNVLIQYPDATEQQEIIDVLDTAERTVKLLTQRLRAAEEVKRSLLHSLLTSTASGPRGLTHA